LNSGVDIKIFFDSRMPRSAFAKKIQ